MKDLLYAARNLSQYNPALRDVIRCREMLQDPRNNQVFQNVQGHFLVGQVVNPSNPTAKEVLGAVNLSLALRNASWHSYREDARLEQPGLATLVGISNKQDHPALTRVPLTVNIPASLQPNDELATSRLIGPDSRQMIRCEVTAMAAYTTNSYAQINAFLRSDSSYTPHASTETVSICGNTVPGLLETSIQAISGLNKNKLPVGTEERALEFLSPAFKEEKISYNSEIVRLLSNVPQGMRAQLTSLTEEPISAPGIQSWTHFPDGSPDIQDGKLFRLKMHSNGQRPLVDYFGWGREGEIAFGPGEYRVCAVEIKDHKHAKTGLVTKIIEVTVEQVLDKEQNACDNYWFQDALSVAHHNHLRHFYKNDPAYEYEGIARPNHALAHHARVGLNIDDVVDYFKEHATPDLKTYCEALTHADREKLKVFMAFSRAGRESENDFRSKPEAYKKELAASAESFKTFVLARQIMPENEVNLWCRVMQDMGNPAFDTHINIGSREDLAAYDKDLTDQQKKEAKYLHHIVNLAHKIDLPRCFSLAEYEHAVSPYTPCGVENALVPKSEGAEAQFKKIQCVAQKRILETGDNITWDSNTRRNKTLFVACNKSVLVCLDACVCATLQDQVVSEVKSILDKLDKVLLTPLLYRFYLKLSELNIPHFPSDESEMSGFLSELFANETLKASIDPSQLPLLFCDTEMWNYIFFSKIISSDTKLKFFELTQDHLPGEHFKGISAVINLLNLTGLKSNQRSKIISTVKDRLPTLIKNFNDLVNLFNYAESKDYQVIINAFEGHWRELVGGRVCNLEDLLTFEPLRGHHEAIIKAVEGHWRELVGKRVGNLKALLTFDLLKDHHEAIINAFEGHWHELVGGNIYNLKALLTFDLLKDHHEAIINAFEGHHWRELIGGRVYDLKALLTFDLLKDHHEAIINAFEGHHWRELVGGGVYDLKALLTFDLLKDQHEAIINAFEGHWRELVEGRVYGRVYDLKALLTFDLLKDHHEAIINAVKGSWGELVGGSVYNLKDLLTFEPLRGHHEAIQASYDNKIDLNARHRNTSSTSASLAVASGAGAKNGPGMFAQFTATGHGAVSQSNRIEVTH